MASSVTNSFKGRLMGDTSQIGTRIELAQDTIKMMWLTTSHTPNDDTDVFIDDVSTNEVSASGSYSLGGVTLTVTSSTDDTDNEGVFDASDVTITSYTGSPAFAVFYKDTGIPATSPIICTQDYGGAQTQAAGTIVVAFADEGILNLG